jgi:4-hydroxybenzoate polyprenyltransferase
MDAVWRLTRFKEYGSFVIVTTLLGAAAGSGSLGWTLLVVLAANWLAVGFAFMVNDVEDAPDDALSPDKAQRNPVASGDLSHRRALFLSFAVAIMAAALYASLGQGPLVVGVSCLVLAYFYSSRGIRLKATPFADLASHALILAGMQFLCAYLAFGGGTVLQWASPLVFVLAISLYGQLFNELRDFDGDLEAGITHTASLLGRRRAHLLMMAWLPIALGSAAVAVFIARVVPIWVILATVALSALFSWRRLPEVRQAQSTIDRHRPLQKPVEIAAATALLAWFATPFAPAIAARILVGVPW